MNSASPANKEGVAERERGVEALYAIGHWLLSEERHADAVHPFRAMVLVAPLDERSWLALGQCHEQLEQASIALEMYQTGTLLVPRSSRCELARARVLRVLGRDGEAEDALDNAEAIADTYQDEAMQQLISQERRMSWAH